MGQNQQLSVRQSGARKPGEANVTAGELKLVFDEQGRATLREMRNVDVTWFDAFAGMVKGSLDQALHRPDDQYFGLGRHYVNHGVQWQE